MEYEEIRKIFHVKPRKLLKSVPIYLAMLLLAPITLSISFYITAHLAILMESSSITSGINILPTVSYLMIWALF